MNNEKGYVRAFDVRHRAGACGFSTRFPLLGRVSVNESWEQESWANTGNAGVWGQISVDETTRPSCTCPWNCRPAIIMGGHRPGNGLFWRDAGGAGSDDRTAQMALPARASRQSGTWTFPMRRSLPDINVNGRAIKAGRSADQNRGWLYVFGPRGPASPYGRSRNVPWQRETCRVNGIRPTQPFPTRAPRPYDRQGVSLNDLIDFTPELKEEGAKVAFALQALGRSSPRPVGEQHGRGRSATLMLPSATGGANWPGRAPFDPENQDAVTSIRRTPDHAAWLGSGRSHEIRHALHPLGEPPIPNAPPAGAAAGGGGEGGPVLTVQGLAAGETSIRAASPHSI